MVEKNDETTGIVRHEFGTATPKLCQRDIESLSGVMRQDDIGDTKKYYAESGGEPIDISITSTRLIMFSPSREALMDFEKRLHFEEWEYENVTKADYLGR